MPQISQFFLEFSNIFQSYILDGILIYIWTKFYQERSGKKIKSVKFFNLLLNLLRFCGFAPTLKKVVLN